MSRALAVFALVGVLGIPIEERAAETPVQHELVCAPAPASKSTPRHDVCVVMPDSPIFEHLPEPTPPAPTTAVSPRL
jgi:hypothetical protein